MLLGFLLFSLCWAIPLLAVALAFNMFGIAGLLCCVQVRHTCPYALWTQVSGVGLQSKSVGCMHCYDCVWNLGLAHTLLASSAPPCGLSLLQFHMYRFYLFFIPLWSSIVIVAVLFFVSWIRVKRQSLIPESSRRLIKQTVVCTRNRGAGIGKRRIF